MSNNDSIIEHDNDNDMLSEFKPKIKAFFNTSNAITSKDDLDKFLDTCGLLEIWNSEEEKNTVWHSLLKYMNHNGNITYDSAIKGLRDLFTETTVNNISSSLLISPTKQNELNMFINTIDNDKYLQLKKINILLDMNNRTHLMQSEIQELLTKHKFIKLSKDDIIEFINVIGDNKTKTKNYEIDNTLYTNAMKQMETKLTTEQSVLFGDNNNNTHINESLIYEGTGNDDVDAVELIDDIAQKENEVIDIMNVLFGIKNSFYELNNNLINQYERYINGDDDKLSDVDKTQMEIDKKVKEYDLFMKDITKCNKSANHKIEMLKTIVFKQNNKIKVMEDEYRQLYQQFTDNQQLDIDDEMERLIDENVILTRDKEEKNAMIDNLHKVIQSKDNAISSYQIQCDDLNKQKEELKMSIDELTCRNDKLKNEYDILVNNILNKIQKEEEELITNDKQNDVDVDINVDIDITSINIQTLTIPELHNTLKQMKSPNLIRFALKVSHDYQTLLNEFNAKSKLIDDISHNIDELKCEVNALKQTNAQVQNENNVLKNKLDAYKNEAEINNCFKPSTVLGTRLSRMSRLSRLESAGTKNLFSPGSFSNVSSAAFFSGQKQLHTTNSLTTPFEYGDKAKCSASKVNATAQKANAVNMKGNIDEIQEGNEDDEEDKEKSMKGGMKNVNEGDDDTGEWELMTNIRNVPIEKGKGSSKKGRVNLNKLIIGNVFANGNDESINNANNIPKTMRDKSLKSFGFNSQTNSGMENSVVNVDNSGNDSSVQVQSSIKDNNVSNNNSEVHLNSNEPRVKLTPINKSMENEGINSKLLKNTSISSLQSQDNFKHNTHSSLEQAIENANINEIEIIPSNKSIPPIQLENETPSITEELQHKTPTKKGYIHIKSSLVPNKNLTAKNDNLTCNQKETQLHLNIIKIKQLSTILEKHNETTTEDKIFNDQVFDIECNDRKVKATLILTPNGIYLLNSDDYSEKQYHQCNSLTTIILSTKNPNIIVFSFEKDNEDLCIETIRRFEMLYYIRDNMICRSTGKKLPIRYEDNIIISKQSKQFNINVTGNLFNFECAQKYGYLYKYNINSGVSNFSEQLIVLTNIGLLCYDYINKPPTLLIPIIGSNISIIHNDSKYKTSNVFEITTNIGESFIFSAYSKAERDSWVNELKSVQKIYDDKKKAIDTLILQNEDDT